MKTTRHLFSFIGALGVAVSPAMAADLPAASPSISPNPMRAVSALNGKLDLGGGALNGNGLGYGIGSISAPIGNAYGVQLDALAGSFNGDFVGGVSGHGFWRDPSKALAGIYSSYTYADQRFGPVGAGGKSGIQIGRVGAEGELYFNRVSFEAIVGYEAGDIKGRVFSFADMALYPIDNFRMSIGHRYVGGKHVAAGGLEYLTPYKFGSVVPALYAEGRAGEDNYRAVYGGVRFYFGEASKTLIKRHREDDPHTRIPDELFAIPSANDAKKAKFPAPKLPSSGNGFMFE